MTKPDRSVTRLTGDLKDDDLSVGEMEAENNQLFSGDDKD